MIMSIIEWVHRKKLIRYDRLLEFYPLFFFIGLRIRISDDYRRINIRLPIRWYNRNNNGVLFGGLMCMISDPFPALVFEKIIPDTSAWSRAHSVIYLLPAKTSVEAFIELKEEDIDEMKQQIHEKGKAEKKFEYYFVDKNGNQVALVSSSTYIATKKRNIELMKNVKN
jgi:hypothetical protein